MASGRRRVGDEGVVVGEAGVPDLEEHVPGDPVPVGIRGRQAGLELFEPGVEEPLGGLGQGNRLEREIGHRAASRGVWNPRGAGGT